MAITLAVVRKIAHLARIKVLPQDEIILENDLNHFDETILEAFNNPANVSVDTDLSQPGNQPFENSQRFRADKVTEIVHRSAFQKLTDHTQAGLYCVPIVLE